MGYGGSLIIYSRELHLLTVPFPLRESDVVSVLFCARPFGWVRVILYVVFPILCSLPLSGLDPVKDLQTCLDFSLFQEPKGVSFGSVATSIVLFVSGLLIAGS